MALVTCPECGRQNISDQAAACPVCGYPIKKNHITAPELTDQNTLNEYSEKIQNNLDKYCEREYNAIQKPNLSKDLESLEKKKKSKLTYLVCAPLCVLGSVILFCIHEYWIGSIYTILSLFLVCFGYKKSISYKEQKAECDANTYDWEQQLEKKKAEIYVQQQTLVVSIANNITGVRKQKCTKCGCEPVVVANDHLYCVNCLHDEGLADKSKEETNTPKCPICGSEKVVRLGIVNKSVSTAMLGLASSKIGKQWHCNSCGSNF